MYLLNWPIKKLRNWLWIAPSEEAEAPPPVVPLPAEAPPPVVPRQRLLAKLGGKLSIRLALGDARASIVYEGGKEFFSSGAEQEQSTGKKTKKKQLSDGDGQRSEISDHSSGKKKPQQYYLCPDVRHEQKYTKFDDLLEHMEDAHGKEEWSVCNTCQRVSLSNRAGKRHRRKGNQEPELTKPQQPSSSSGGKGNSSAGVLGVVARVGEKFVCPDDRHGNKTYMEFNAFVRHILDEHRDEYWGVCYSCELVFVCRMVADHHKKERAHYLLENEGGVELKQGGLASI